MLITGLPCWLKAIGQLRKATRFRSSTDVNEQLAVQKHRGILSAKIENVFAFNPRGASARSVAPRPSRYHVACLHSTGQQSDSDNESDTKHHSFDGNLELSVVATDVLSSEV